MQVPAWQEARRALAAACDAAGLDLVEAFSIDWYNVAVAAPHQLPTFGRRHCLGILIGNSRVLWPRFVSTLKSDPSLLDAPDPIDRYVETAVTHACTVLPAGSECVFAHGSRRIAIQQVAERAGVAYLSPGHLSVHATFGPWIALRAVVVVDIDGPDGEAPTIQVPCSDCDVRCQPAFARAAATLVEPVNQAAVTPHWQVWLAARDACPIGRAYRYDETQIGYHYTKDKAFLRRALADSR